MFQKWQLLAFGNATALTIQIAIGLLALLYHNDKHCDHTAEYEKTFLLTN